ncbi:SWIB/MDM2 domain family protein [Candida albicans]|uniref:SWIB/MDM2 domain family protein n=1 Tax=Candida albicans TaxID=5476 RepID=A0A8H6F1B1_CANAX|nr:SWIB/MDM2 domain family protein [Candida albicans]
MQSISQQQVPHHPPPANKPRPNAAAVPTISYQPTDIIIPTQLYDKIGNLGEYKRLQEAEKKLDLLIARKSLDFQAIQQKSIHPHEYRPSTGVLRIFIYNTCENQPWQKQLLQQKGLPVPDPTLAESSWTLRIEGKFISDIPDEQQQIDETFKFSSFLSAISVDLLPNENYPNIQESQSHIIEWRDDGPNANKPPASVSFDGLDIKRNGIFNIKSKIALLVKNHSNSLKLSEEMSRFVGKQECSQQELLYIIWQYVLFKADDKDSSDDDLTLVEADDLLFELLKVKTFKFSDLYKLTQAHFVPREPIIVDYEVDTRKSTTLGNVVLDIPVELPLNLLKAQKELLDVNKTAFENLAKADSTISQLDQRISLAIIALQNANSREKFYRELSDDPVKFIENWLESQAETLKALKSDEGYDEEVVRRAKYFEENEHLIKEKIELLLGSNKF